MKVINHLFIGSSWLLVSQMVSKIIDYSHHKHHFIIVINGEHQREQYDRLFANLFYTDYEYWFYLYDDKEVELISSKLKLLYCKLILKGIFVKYKYIYNWLLIFDQIQKSKFDNLILHSEISEITSFLVRGNINVAWCCWGWIPTISNRTAIRRFLRKEYYYRRFMDHCSLIIVLTEADKEKFERVYAYNNIIVSSYSFIYNFKELKVSKSESNRILIGNSAFYLDDYLRLANTLSTLRGLSFTFMCSYGTDTTCKHFERWKNAITEQLCPHNNVDFWTEDISLSEYNKKLGTYQVYIAPMKRQSGLGAITTALSLGLKCYLDGVNYDYYSRKGLKVFSLETISNLTSQELLCFKVKDRNNNSLLVKKVCGIKQSVDTWEKIYETLI